MKRISVPWRFISGLLTCVSLVLLISSFLLLRAERRIVVKYGETYSSLVLTRVRLEHYVEKVDEQNVSMARIQEGRGERALALSYCLDLCRKKEDPFCSALVASHRAQADSIGPLSNGVSAAVCEDLQEWEVGGI